jgi:hypothetical protein
MQCETFQHDYLQIYGSGTRTSRVTFTEIQSAISEHRYQLSVLIIFSILKSVGTTQPPSPMQEEQSFPVAEKKAQLLEAISFTANGKDALPDLQSASLPWWQRSKRTAP